MKSDFLKECLSGLPPIPHNQFAEAYCKRCLNQECGRSLGSVSKMADRAANWVENLFVNVKRVKDSDVGMEGIRFESIEDNSPPVIVQVPEKFEVVQVQESKPVIIDPGVVQGNKNPFVTQVPKEKTEEVEPKAKEGATFTFGDE